MKERVVITGLGVVSPNGVGIDNFALAIRNGISGIRFVPEMERLGFSCQIAGQPVLSEEKVASYFTPLQLKGFNSNGILYGIIAGIDAWKNAGLPLDTDDADWDSGCLFGTGTSGVDKFREAIYKLDEGKVRRLGSTTVQQTMASGVSAYLGGMLSLGNQVSTNSSACITGTESILLGYERILAGKAKRMLVGSCSDASPYLWGGFDAMKVCTYKHNNAPEEGSRPMSASASGFVPGSGAGAMVIESLESAIERKATIYAEIAGGHVNSGGQTNGGSMTAPNSIAVQRCIREALKDAKVHARQIDAINGHLTATSKDPTEIENWAMALERSGDDFPYVNSLKSMVGHALAASGSIECVASVLQLHHGFLFPNINCEDIHPEITDLIAEERIVRSVIEKKLEYVAKASFGFGDVNGCIIFKSFKN
ncbi:beta-ketoacyl-[acyl-carrier-protein] synthase family protein [Sungkyunkwania multivorans]|uniref:3-oxoacyl-[acyl-carrier-protein] synthase 1 n=1 Tax=Sungkyunkwania multivorans TaxID=1173618 RepID=A0ABW3CZ30_9FLAO